MSRSVSRVVGQLLEINLRFHRHCAWLLVINTGIHVGAHLYNAYSLQRASTNAEHLYNHCAEIRAALLNLNSTANVTGSIGLNGTGAGAVFPSDDWIRKSVAPELLQSGVRIVFATLPGFSGVVMTLVLIIIALTAAVKVWIKIALLHYIIEAQTDRHNIPTKVPDI